jgi:hypothetical protein
MSDQDETKDDLSKQDITRRATFRLATAVAAFGVALGVRASTASAAQADMFLKLEPKKNKGGGKTEKQEYIKKDKGQEKQEFRKFKYERQ